MISSRVSFMVRHGCRNGAYCRFRKFPEGLPKLKLACGTTRLCRVGCASLSTCEPPELRYVNNSMYSKKVLSRSASGAMAVIVAFVAGACAAAGFGRRDVVECEGNVEQQLINDVGKPSQNGRHILKYDHVVIGSGTTASAAIEGILLMQSDAKILLIAPEPDITSLDGNTTSFDISKEEGQAENELVIGPDLLESFTQWRRHITKWLADDCEAMKGPVDVIRNPSVKINIEDKTILIGERAYKGDGSMSHFQKVKYDKCVLAPTGKPRKLYVLDGDRAREDLRHSINTLQSLEDFQSLETLFADEERNIKHVSIIGGGFLGSEMAVALAKRGASEGVEIAHIYAEQYPMQRILPVYLAKLLQKRFKKLGITPVGEHLVTDIHYDMESGRIVLLIKGWEDRSFETDYVVLASTHIDPDVTIAKNSGIETDKFTGGVVVNSQLEAVDGLYAAGGSCSFFDRSLGRRRIDRYDHAINSGLIAGHNMASSLLTCYSLNRSETDKQTTDGVQSKCDLFPLPLGPRQQMYAHQPMLRSNLGNMDIVIEGIGEIDARLQTVGLWVNKHKSPHKGGEERPYHRGVIYYLRGDKIVGILLWNTTDLLERARDVIARQSKITSVKNLMWQIPIAPDDWLRIEETPAHISLTDMNNTVLTPPF